MNRQPIQAKRLRKTIVTYAGLIMTYITNAQTETTPSDTIFLNTDQRIDEVVVKHQTPVVKLKTDKVTYQIANDAESKTRSVLDMLRKVPMVTVDGRNNITVNGSAQFKVYVDGRLNSTITRNPSKMLRNMPASNVKNIEVITNPGAQYDAEGAGGVLCIYTKKGEAKKTLAFSDENTESATTGSIHATAGLRSWGSDISLSHQAERLSWDLNLNGEYWYSPDASIESEATSNGTRQWMKQKSVSKMPGAMGDFGIGYEIDSVRSIHANVSVNRFGIKDVGSPLYQYSGGMWGSNTIFTGRQTTKMNEVGIDGSIDYQRTWAERGRLFMNYQISHSPSQNESENKYDSTASFTPEMSMILRDNRTQMSEHNTVHNLLTDISIPLNDDHIINTGLKLTADIGDSDAKEMLSDGYVFAENTNGSIHFRQHQYITALYAEWDAQWGWFGMKNGVRYEHTWQQSGYLKGNGSNFSLNYGALVPSASLSARAGERSTLGLNYNMRIRRPRINELDPYINSADPTQLVYGNPKLDAQHLHHMTFVYTFSANKIALRMSLGQSWSNDGISQYSEMKDNRIHTTYGNVSKNRTSALNTYVSWSMTGKTRLTLNGEVAYSDMRSPMLNQHNDGWFGSANVGFQQNLPWELKWATNLEWMSRRNTLQGYNSGMTSISTTLTRSFCDDKWNVAISGMTGLGHGGKMIWESVSRNEDFANTVRYIDAMQDITIGITYSFGATRAKPNYDMQMSPDFEMEDGDSNRSMRFRRR